ncbi:VCBS repeat-containing protein, partial [Pyxidicoccus fallax]
RSIARALALTDLDGDGRQDVVVSSGVAQVVSVFQGASTGGFSERWDFTLAVPPSGLALADFNGDGRADVAVAQGANDSVRILATRCGR